VAGQVVLVAILRKGEMLLPHGDLRMQAVDEVLALVHADEVAKLHDILGHFD
jgi:trk system potassium uptake protein TrkA